MCLCAQEGSEFSQLSSNCTSTYSLRISWLHFAIVWEVRALFEIVPSVSMLMCVLCIKYIHLCLPKTAHLPKRFSSCANYYHLAAIYITCMLRKKAKCIQRQSIDKTHRITERHVFVQSFIHSFIHLRHVIQKFDWIYYCSMYTIFWIQEWIVNKNVVQLGWLFIHLSGKIEKNLLGTYLFFLCVYLIFIIRSDVCMKIENCIILVYLSVQLA